MNKLLFMIWIAGCLVCVSQRSESQAASPYPIVDKIADKIIQKYQTSSCEQLKQQKQQKQQGQPPNAQKEEMEQKVIEQLKKDPQMRQHFLDRVAGPIANKMFECGMIP